MNAMIMRRFSKPGDVERARKYVLQVRLIPNISALPAVQSEIHCLSSKIARLHCRIPAEQHAMYNAKSELLSSLLAQCFSRNARY